MLVMSLHDCIISSHLIWFDLVLIVHYLECPSGSYKHTIDNTKCIQCPSNSASNAERTDCTCDRGFYKSTDLADCKGTRFLIIQYFVLDAFI